jgi:hypothetical protein
VQKPQVVAQFPEEETGSHLTENTNGLSSPKIKLCIVVYVINDWICMVYREQISPSEEK